jgi:hypothetical protein
MKIMNAVEPYYCSSDHGRYMHYIRENTCCHMPFSPLYVQYITVNREQVANIALRLGDINNRHCKVKQGNHPKESYLEIMDLRPVSKYL